jgi:LmbE family N-acetylglucosaminyl deacetylase
MDMKFKVILLLVSIVSLTVIVFSYSQLPFYPPDYPAGPTINAGDRVLIVAPHPDDEVICNGGVISYAVENHIPVKVVVVTDGNDTKTSPLIRHNETINGTEILGLGEENVTFLGYKDGSLRNLLNDNWNYNNPFTAADGSKQVTYPYAFQENATYCGANLAENLETIIVDFKPTIIIYPSGDDEQFDHQATSGFIEYTTQETGYNGSKYTYLLHLPPDWPSPRSYYPEYYLVPPKQMVGVENGPEWFVFNLTTLEMRFKEQSLRSYKTQIVPSSYLLSFLRKNELFAKYPTLNVSKSTDNSSLSDFADSSKNLTNLFYDAAGDGKYHGKEKSLDIVSVGIDVNDAAPNGKSWVSLKTVGEPSLDAVYNIHMNIFNPGGTERVKISVQNGSGEIQREVNGSSIRNNIPVIIKNKTLVTEIPSDLFKNSSYFILSADTTKSGAIIDQTPWRVIKITG